MGFKHVTEEERKKIIALYKPGDTGAEIARCLAKIEGGHKRSGATIVSVLRSAGLWFEKNGQAAKPEPKHPEHPVFIHTHTEVISNSGEEVYTGPRERCPICMKNRGRA